MSKSLKLNLMLLGVVGLILIGFFYVSSISKLKAQTNSTNLIGYAWNENIGWISFSSENVAASESMSVQSLCTPTSPLTQALSCPSGQTGSITQTRTSVCPGPVTSGWATTSNTCVTSATIPGAPVNPTATAGNAQASVTFSAPASDGGSAITSYTVTSNPGNITKIGSAGPLIVTGLINGTSYTFTVVATNAIGASLPSISNSVIPIYSLVWSGTYGPMNWANAKATCAAQGWRLPTKSELQTSLADQFIKTPPTQTGFVPGATGAGAWTNPTGNYWSSTSCTVDNPNSSYCGSGDAWYCTYVYLYVPCGAYAYTDQYFRCVY